MTTNAVTATQIKADPSRVYAALTTEQGLTGWWSATADVGTRVGETIRFRWTDPDHTTMRIDLHELDRCVRWTCVEQSDRNLPQLDEWVGTVVQFDIAPSGDGCLLTVTHEGLLELACGEVCSRGWSSFMAGSLKPLVETGRGNPWSG